MCILVVEDEVLIAMAVEDVLREANHEVMTAGNVPAAIHLIAQHPELFTCLVTDFRMPYELTGADLIEHMRPLYPAIPIILFTAMGSAVTSEWRMRHRVELIEKPYAPEVLAKTVARLLKDGQRNGLPEFWGAALISLEGEVACEAGLPRWHNPYVFGTSRHHAWDEGWGKVQLNEG